MRKHTKAGLVLLMAGMMMAGSVTSAFADTEATAATSGVIDTTTKNAETGRPGKHRSFHRKHPGWPHLFHGSPEFQHIPDSGIHFRTGNQRLC